MKSGPTEFIRAGHLAAAFDVPLSSHLFGEMSLSLLAAAPNAYILEHMPWFEPIYAERIELDAEGRALVGLRHMRRGRVSFLAMRISAACRRRGFQPAILHG
jgi:hypothetical protein